MISGSDNSNYPYALYEPRKKHAIKGKVRSGGGYLTPLFIHLCVFKITYAI